MIDFVYLKEVDEKLLQLNEFNFEELEYNLNQILKKNPNDIHAMLFFARFLTHPVARSVGAKQAEAVLEPLLIKHSNRIDILILLVESIYWNRNNLSRADQYTAQAFQSDPKNVDVLLIRSLFLRLPEVKREEESINLLETFLLQSTSVDILKELANLYEEIQPARAFELYQRLIELEPLNPEWYCNAGRLAWKQLDNKIAKIQSLTFLKMALSLKPDYLAPLVQMGEIHWQSGRFQEALTVYEQAITRVSEANPFFEWFYLHPSLQRLIGLSSNNELLTYYNIFIEHIRLQHSYKEGYKAAIEAIEEEKNRDIWNEYCQIHNINSRVQTLPKQLQVAYATACISRTLKPFLEWINRYDPKGAALVQKGLEIIEKWIQNQKTTRLRSLEERLENYQEILEERLEIPLPYWVSNLFESLYQLIVYINDDNYRKGLDLSLKNSFWSSAYAEIYSNPYLVVRIKNDALSYLITKSQKIQNEFDFRDWALTEIAQNDKPLTNEQSVVLRILSNNYT